MMIRRIKVPGEKGAAPASMPVIAAALLLVTAGALCPIAGRASGTTSESPFLSPQPELYFNLAYCGSGRRDHPSNHLDRIDWREEARGYRLTILRRHTGEYRDVAKSLRRRSPDHTIAVYQHSHALFQNEDRPAALNLTESNFLHGTDPAAMRVTPVPGGLLVDWAGDERWAYDEYGVTSPAREFEVTGYVLRRSGSAGEFEPLARLTPAVTAFVDSTARAGETYRYVVDTVHQLGHELPFSFVVEGVRPIDGEDGVAFLLSDYQRAIRSRVDEPSYALRVRIHATGAVSNPRLLIDRNVDRDFDDPDETVPMLPTPEGWLEAVTSLDAAARTRQDLHRVMGFAYKLEFEVPDGTVTLPDYGAFTTTINNRIRSRHYGFYIMRPDSEHWIEHLAGVLRQQVGRSSSVDAIFFDDLIVYPRYAGDADPIDITTEGFQAASVTLVNALSERYPALEIFYNGAGKGIDPPETTGGMIEGFCLATWFRGGSAEFYAPPDIWEQQVRQALLLAASDRGVLLLARDAAAGDRRARLYALASFHLVRGEGSRFCYLPTACGARPLPEWQVALGAPRESFLEPAEARQGQDGAQLYRRRFERGSVWVNADRHRLQTVELERPGLLVELSGEQGATVVVERLVERLELEPQSGAIVVWPTAGE